MRRMYSENQLEGIIKSEVESGTLSNAKPIYCHPITIAALTEDIGAWYLTFLIFNNSATPFTKETFVAFVRSLDDAIFLCSGNYRGLQVYSIQKDLVNANCVTLNVYDSSTIVAQLDGRDFNDYTLFSDGVNKIN